MALITCPECGRNNVSDTAENCPECGFAIKQHFENLEQQKIQEEKIQEETEKLKPELDAKLKEIDEMQPPKEPEYQLFASANEKFVFGLLVFITAVLVILAFISSLWVLLIAGFFGALIWTQCNSAKETYEFKLKQYKERTEDWEGWKAKEKERIISEYKDYAFNLATYGNKFGKIIPRNLPKCPHCASTNIKRISDTNRTVSVLTWGLASSKIGMQYECKSCKHKW